MTSSGADDARVSGSSEVSPHDGRPATRGALLCAGAVSALFVTLFWPILAVRLHFYLETPRYSHCVLLPFVAALWVWDRWDAVRAVPRAASRGGFAFLAVGVALYVYGRLLRNNHVQDVAMVATVAGLVWALTGAKMLRALAFPVGYLALMIPLKPWDEAITLPLQRIATVIAESFFKALGWIVVREGNVIQLPRLKLLVEDGCSGAHSLLALLCLSVAWVFFVERPVWLRVTLVAASIPIAVLANAVRVSVTGVLAYKVNPAYAQGVSHQTAGMVVFAIGVALTLGLDWCLKPDADPDPRSDDAEPA